MKITLAFRFILFFCLLSQTDTTAQAIDSWGPQWEVGQVNAGEFVLPDSLGGAKLEGYIAMVLWVSKSGKLIGYYVTGIYAYEKATRQARYRYTLGARDPESAQRAKSARGAEVLSLFARTIEEYTKRIRFTPNPKFEYWAGDSANIGHTVEFNRSK